MPRYAQLVIGPAGCGKSTYCSTIQSYGNLMSRPIRIFNLDPDAENFDYEIHGDIRDLIAIENLNENDVQLGPNGGLIFCMEYLLKNLDWFDDQIGDYEDDYFIFDCPGQIELYAHLDTMQNLVQHLKIRFNFRICTVCILDCHFLTNSKLYLSSAITTLTSNLHIAGPFVNVMMKVDLLSDFNKKKMLEIFDEDIFYLANSPNVKKSPKYRSFLTAMAQFLENNSVGKFIPFDITDYESIQEVLWTVDNCIGYGEDLDAKTSAMCNDNDNYE